MFGTMIQFRPLSGSEDAIRNYLGGENSELTRNIEGFVTQYVLEPSNSEEDWIGFVVFDSEESYRKNSADPQQHAEYLRWRSQIVADPIWHDGVVRLVEPASVSI